MEPNLRDTPLRRFNTFWWGLALFAVFAIAAVGVRLMDKGERTDIESNRGKVRMETKRKIDSEQSTDRDSYKKLGEGKVQVKPEDVFGLAKEIGLLDEPKASAAKHNMKFN